MVAQVEDVVLDGGLTAFKNAARQIFVCSSEPTTFAIASSGAASLGKKDFGTAGSCLSAVTAGTSPTGRKVTTTAITDGTILTTGTASWWAICDTASLYAHGSLSATQAVTAGNTFSLGAFDVRIANQ